MWAATATTSTSATAPASAPATAAAAAAYLRYQRFMTMPVRGRSGLQK